MCTVLLRVAPGARWPLLLAAVRDEFLARPWDPPGPHWSSSPGLVGGRDRLAGGTWLAVRSPTPDAPPAVAALLNGARLPPPPGPRPSRGGLPLAVLRGEPVPQGQDLAGYDGFHLILATPDTSLVWTWDGTMLRRSELAAGDHIVVNDGVDTVDDPLVPHFAPLLAAVPTPALPPGAPTAEAWGAAPTAEAWGAWVDLLRGDGLPPDDPRALIVRHEFGGHVYGSSSASLIALAPDAVRFDFTATPADPTWAPVPLPLL